MSKFLEQLSDGIANAFGVQTDSNSNKYIPKVQYGKGVLVPKYNKIPTIKKGNVRKQFVAQQQTQDKGIATNTSGIKSLQKQIEDLTKQSAKQQQMLNALNHKLRKRQVSVNRYAHLQRIIRKNQHEIHMYKKELNKQKNWVTQQMHVWKKQNSHKKNSSNNSAYMQMMKKQLQLLEKIARQNAKASFNLQKKRRSNFHGNVSFTELKRELDETQRLLRSRRRMPHRKLRLKRSSIYNRRLLRRNRRALNVASLLMPGVGTARLLRHGFRTAKRFGRNRRALNIASAFIPGVGTARLLRHGFRTAKRFSKNRRALNVASAFIPGVGTARLLKHGFRTAKRLRKNKKVLNVASALIPTVGTARLLKRGFKKLFKRRRRRRRRRFFRRRR